jgi:hypothetical protein
MVVGADAVILGAEESRYRKGRRHDKQSCAAPGEKQIPRCARNDEIFAET